MAPDCDMTTASGFPGGHWRELAITRYDKPHLRVKAELRVAVLSHECIQDTLVEIGPPVSPPTLKATNQRARRILRVSGALRSVLGYHEVDYYSEVISERRAAGIWAKGKPPPSRPGFDLEETGRDGNGRRKRRGPDRATVLLAADALAEGVKAARAGVAENLPQYERDALNRVLAFLGYSGAEARRRSGFVLSPEAAKKARQRSRKARASIVSAEREELEREVVAGRMIRISETTYVSADPPDPL